MKIFSRKSRKGFTLIELLAVIAIIAILAAMGLVAYSSAQKSARNAQRVGDMKSIQATLEQYAAENGGVYSWWDTMDNGFPGGAYPTDPTNSGIYIYSRVRTAAAPITEYCYCARLETPTNAGNATGTTGVTCNWATSGETHYCVSNQQ